MMAPDRTQRRKIVLLGDAAVGKTSVVRRAIEDSFSDEYIATIGTKVSRKAVEVTHEGEDWMVEFQVWDVLGQHGYTGVQRASLQGAAGAILVWDGTRPETLLHLGTLWLPLLYERSWNIPVLLVANKSDLPGFDAEEATMHEIAWLHAQAYPHGILDKEGIKLTLTTSAKTGEGVEQMFADLARLILHFPTASDPISETIARIREQKATLPPKSADLKAFVDWLLLDHLDGRVDAVQMDNLRIEVIRARLDIRVPKPDAIERLMDCLFDLDTEHLEPDVAHRRQERRRTAWAIQTEGG